MTRDSESSELVLLNGRVITGDRESSIQQAVAIRSSHILAVTTSGLIEEIAHFEVLTKAMQWEKDRLMSSQSGSPALRRASIARSVWA
jgi:hypothetical protein